MARAREVLGRGFVGRGEGKLYLESEWNWSAQVGMLFGQAGCMFGDVRVRCRRDGVKIGGGVFWRGGKCHHALVVAIH